MDPDLILKIVSSTSNNAPIAAVLLGAWLLRHFIQAVAILMLTGKNQTAARIEMLRIMNREPKKSGSKGGL